ncbi:MAG: hypothetical protein ACLPVY_19455 [Acidimicrobiia bacterium]
MKTRSKTYRSIVLAAVVLIATAALGAAGDIAPASGAQRAAQAKVMMPDAGVAGCDVLLTAPVGHHCLLPWPNDAFTVPSNTPTGRRLNISSKVDPSNSQGTHVATTAENAGDGFSPGSVIMTYVSGLSLSKSNIATSTNIGLSLAADSPIVVLDTVTHTRVPYFAELDAQTLNPAEQLLLIHPAVALTEGHRYAVALRNLVNNSGAAIAPLASTAAALAGTLKPATRGAHIKFVIRDDLASVLGSTVPYQAWDFTVASEQSLAGPALTMHKLAYQWLATHHRESTSSAPNDLAPSFAVTSMTDTNGVRDVHGTFQVPLFLADTTPFSALVTDRAGNPIINGDKTWTANFICVLPSTVQSGGPATPTVYGHGLLGNASEVEGSSFSAGVADNLMGCATDWVGMSTSDIPNVARNLKDMSTFDTQVDHMLQGFVNFQFLGRLINSSSGFVTNPAFQSSGQPLFKTHDCHFMGYSQGGIMGGAVSALSTEWTRAILGVPGMDYGGLLLNRSVDWNEFAAVFDKSYTDPVDQQVVLQLAQLLWDRGENEGYAEHLTANPYPGIPAKQIFIIENYGDHQVANVAAEMLARTIGAQNHQPAFNPQFFGATPRVDVPVTPQWGLSKLDQNEPAKAGLVLWDYGTPTPPTTNLAPDGAAYGADPHGDGRGNASLLTQITTFLSTGVIPDVCDAMACQSNTP